MTLRTPPSWLQNGSHPAENDRLTMQTVWKTTGTIGTSSLAVTQNSTPNMSVLVASGYAAIVGSLQPNMGVYLAFNDAAANVTITAANATNPRIDLICVTISDSYYSGTLNQVAFNVVAGTPAPSPVAPSTPANSIALASVYVAANATSIVTGNITDLRVAATSYIGIDPTSTVTAAGFTATTSQGFTNSSANGVGKLDDAILQLMMGAY